MDISSFLRRLSDHDVRHVLIGALAFPHYGYGRSTLDVDVFIDPSLDNAQKTLAALTAFGFDTADLSVDDLLRYKVLIRDYRLDVDVHPFVTGVTFEPVFQRSETASIGDVEIRVPCLDDLIVMKAAAGRPKDLEDLRVLTEIRRRRGVEAKNEKPKS